MVLKPNKKILKELKDFDEYINNNNKEIYDAMPINSRIIRTLRKTNYNFVVYEIMSHIKIIKKKLE